MGGANLIFLLSTGRRRDSFSREVSETYVYIQMYTYRCIHTTVYIQMYTYRCVHTDVDIQMNTYRRIHTDAWRSFFSHKGISLDIVPKSDFDCSALGGVGIRFLRGFVIQI